MTDTKPIKFFDDGVDPLPKRFRWRIRGRCDSCVYVVPKTLMILERETGLEPATSTLARLQPAVGEGSGFPWPDRLSPRTQYRN